MTPGPLEDLTPRPATRLRSQELREKSARSNMRYKAKNRAEAKNRAKYLRDSCDIALGKKTVNGPRKPINVLFPVDSAFLLLTTRNI